MNTDIMNGFQTFPSKSALAEKTACLIHEIVEILKYIYQT
jgi:hypothetical protein